MPSDNPFKWRQFEPGLILLCVRWYLRYAVSYRDLEEMMRERGLCVDHTTIYRWVQRSAPEIDKRCRLGRPAQVYWLCVPLQNGTYRRVARADLESAISIIDAMSEAVHRHDYTEIEDAFDTLVVRAAIALCNLLKLWKARN